MSEATHAHTFVPGVGSGVGVGASVSAGVGSAVGDGVSAGVGSAVGAAVSAGVGAGVAPLLLLHGSDGRETDLLPLASALAPGAARLGVRGTVATEAGWAFFHRLPDCPPDEADLATRLPALADFVETFLASAQVAARPVALGFSNGAIMAAALLMNRPGLLAGAILLRPMPPFTADPPHDLRGVPVLIIDGADDVRRSPGDGLRLADQLRRGGARVTHHVLPVGHAVTDEDQRIARDWLAAEQQGVIGQ